MREKKIKILVGILLTLVLFSSSAALLMFMKQDSSAMSSKESVRVYMASKALDGSKPISAEDISEIHMPKAELRFTPLSSSEIVGMYVQSDMLQGELFRAEKLALTQKALQTQPTQIAKESEEVLIESIQDTLVLNLTLFQNMDTTLKAGDFIDIVSIMPTQEKNKEYEFKPQYIALHIPVVGINYETQIQNEKDKKAAAISVAKSIVVGMKPEEIKSFLDLYYTAQNINAQRYYNEQNRGHLWMVKCAKEGSAEATQAKKSMLIHEKAPQPSPKAAPKRQERVSIAYEE